MLRLAATNSIVLVPVENAREVGLRSPITAAEGELLMKNLADDFNAPPADWKDRFKEFSEKMRTGDIFAVAEVIKTLTYLSQFKPLSFREQRMLEARAVFGHFGVEHRLSQTRMRYRRARRSSPGRYLC